MIAFYIGWQSSERSPSSKDTSLAKAETQAFSQAQDGQEKPSQSQPPLQRAIKWSTFDLIHNLDSDDESGMNLEAERKLRAMLESDPHETMYRLGELPEAHRGTNVLPHLLNEFLPELTVQEAGSLIQLLKNNPELYRTVVDFWANQVVSTSSENDSALYGWIKNIADEPLAADGLANAVGYILFRDGGRPEKLDEVWNVATELPEGAVKSRIIENSVRQFLTPETIEHVVPLIETLPSSPLYDEVFANFSESVSEFNTENAFHYFDRIQNQDVRNRVIDTVAETWSQRDKGALKGWVIENSSLFSDGELIRLSSIAEL